MILIIRIMPLGTGRSTFRKVTSLGVADFSSRNLRKRELYRGEEYGARKNTYWLHGREAFSSFFFGKSP